MESSGIREARGKERVEEVEKEKAYLGPAGEGPMMMLVCCSPQTAHSSELVGAGCGSAPPLSTVWPGGGAALHGAVTVTLTPR